MTTEIPAAADVARASAIARPELAREWADRLAKQINSGLAEIARGRQANIVDTDIFNITAHTDHVRGWLIHCCDEDALLQILKDMYEAKGYKVTGHWSKDRYFFTVELPTLEGG